MKMKTSLTLIIILLILTPQVEGRRLKKKKIEPVSTFGIFSTICFFTIVKMIGAYRLKGKGELTREVALRMVKEIANKNAVMLHMVTACRNASKIYDMKMNELVKIERLLIQAKYYRKTKFSGREVSCPNPDTEINYSEIKTKVQFFSQRMQKELNKRNLQNPEQTNIVPDFLSQHGKSKTPLTKPFKSERVQKQIDDSLPSDESQSPNLKEENQSEEEKDLEVLCMLESIEAMINPIIERMSKLAELDVTDICSSNLIPYLGKINDSVARKTKLIKENEAVFKKSINFVYRMFMSKCYEHISEKLDYSTLTDSSLADLAEKGKVLNNLTKEKHGSWKDQLFGLGYGGAEFGLALMSETPSVKDFLEKLFEVAKSPKESYNEVKSKVKAIFKPTSKKTLFNKNNFEIRKLIHSIRKRRNKTNHQSNKIELKTYFEGTKWFGIGKVINEIFELCLASYNSSNFSTKIENELSNAFSPYKWENNFFYKFHSLKEFKMTYDLKKMRKLTRTLDQLTKNVRLEETKPLSADSFGKITSKTPFRMVLLKKEMVGNLSEKEMDLINKGKYYNKVRIAYSPIEVKMFAKDKFELLSIYDNGPNAKSEVVFENQFERSNNTENAEKIPLVEMKTESSEDKHISKYFFVMAIRGKGNEKGEMMLFHKIYKHSFFQENSQEVDLSFQTKVEDKMRNDMKKSIFNFYKDNCDKIESIIKIERIVNSCKLKMKLGYDYYLGYLKCPIELVEQKENVPYRDCLNKYGDYKAETAVKLIKSSPDDHLYMIKSGNGKRMSTYDKNGKMIPIYSNKETYDANISVNKSEFTYYAMDHRGEENNEILQFVKSLNTTNQEINLQANTLLFSENKNINIQPDQSFGEEELFNNACKDYKQKINKPISEYPNFPLLNSSDGFKLIKDKFGIEVIERNNEFSFDYPIGKKKNDDRIGDLLVKSKDGESCMLLQDYLLSYNRLAVKSRKKDKKMLITMEKNEIFDFYQVFQGFSSDNDDCRPFTEIMRYNSRREYCRNSYRYKVKKPGMSFSKKDPWYPKNIRIFENSFNIAALLGIDIEPEEEDYIIKRSWENKKNLELLGSCKYANISVKVNFSNPIENPQFVIYSSETTIEVAMEENLSGELEVKPFVVIAATLINTDENNYDLVNNFEKRCYNLNYAKIKRNASRSMFDFKIFLPGKKKYILINFWNEVDVDKYEDYHKEVCPSDE